MKKEKKLLEISNESKMRNETENTDLSEDSITIFFKKNNDKNLNETVGYDRTISEDSKEDRKNTKLEESPMIKKEYTFKDKLSPSSSSSYSVTVSLQSNKKSCEQNSIISTNRKNMCDGMETSQEADKYNINVNSILNSTMHGILRMRPEKCNNVLHESVKKEVEKSTNVQRRNKTSNMASQVSLNTRDQSTTTRNDSNSNEHTHISTQTPSHIYEFPCINSPVNASIYAQLLCRINSSSSLYTNYREASVFPSNDINTERYHMEDIYNNDIHMHLSCIECFNFSKFLYSGIRLLTPNTVINQSEIKNIIKEGITEYITKIEKCIKCYDTSKNCMYFLENLQKANCGFIKEMNKLEKLCTDIFKQNDSSEMEVVDYMCYNYFGPYPMTSSMLNYITEQNKIHMKRLYNQTFHDQYLMHKAKKVISNLNKMFTYIKNVDQYNGEQDKSIMENIESMYSDLLEEQISFENLVNKYIDSYDKEAESFNSCFASNISYFIMHYFRNIEHYIVSEQRDLMISKPKGKEPCFHHFVKHILSVLQIIYSFVDKFIENWHVLSISHLDNVIAYIDSFSIFFKYLRSSELVTNSAIDFYKNVTEINYDFVGVNTHNDHVFMNQILQCRNTTCTQSNDMKNQFISMKKNYSDKKKDPSVDRQWNSKNKTINEKSHAETRKSMESFVEKENSEIEETKHSKKEPQNTKNQNITVTVPTKEKKATENNNLILHHSHNKERKIEKSNIPKESMHCMLENLGNSLDLTHSSSNESTENNEYRIKKKVRVSFKEPQDMVKDYEESLRRNSVPNETLHNEISHSQTTIVEKKNKRLFSQGVLPEGMRERSNSQTMNQMQRTYVLRTRKTYPNKKYMRPNPYSLPTNKYNNRVNQNENKEINRIIISPQTTSTSITYTRQLHLADPWKNRRYSAPNNQQYFPDPNSKM